MIQKAPHSAEAERTILGAVLVDNIAMATAVPVVRPKDFYLDPHKRVFKAMLALYEDSKPIDAVTIADRLAAAGELDRVGGAAFIASLYDGLPRLTNVESWCAIVKEKAALRTVAVAANRMLAETESPDAEAKAVIERAGAIMQQTLEETMQVAFKEPEAGTKEALRALEAIVEHASKGEATGLELGYVDLDQRLGGLQPGDYVIVGARPSMGKSSFLVNVGDNLAADGKVVALFSAEMATRQINVRRLCAEARVPMTFFRGQSEPVGDEWERIARCCARLVERRFYIDDASHPTPMELRGKARYLKAMRGLDVVLVDYLQFLGVDQLRKNETREQEVSRISRSLKKLARELGVVVIAAAQLSRASEHRRNPEPVLADLRESGAIEQDADVVLFLHRARERDEDQELSDDCKVIIAKQRNGPTGVVHLRYDGPITRFDNLVRDV